MNIGLNPVSFGVQKINQSPQKQQTGFTGTQEVIRGIESNPTLKNEMDKVMKGTCVKTHVENPAKLYDKEDQFIFFVPFKKFRQKLQNDYAANNKQTRHHQAHPSYKYPEGQEPRGKNGVLFGLPENALKNSPAVKEYVSSLAENHTRRYPVHIFNDFNGGHNSQKRYINELFIKTKSVT